MLRRPLYRKIWEELSAEKSMIFLTGPRQSGKTTFSKIIAGPFSNSLYFNYDILDDRMKLMKTPYFYAELPRKDSTIPLIIFDEIHKYKDWKQYLKGAYDRDHEAYKFLVTGSGRLDTYQKGGDSLAGRYNLFHLFPFTLAELAHTTGDPDIFVKDPLKMTMKGLSGNRKIWHDLAQLSGFPEPYLSGRETTYRRWSNTYSRQVIREDIRDMVDLKSIGDMELLYALLPSKVGSPFSISSAGEDLRVSYNTVKNWLSVLDRFYLTFSVPSWSAKLSRAIQKERKLYLYDYPKIKDPGDRFENMVALELWRAVSLWSDMGLGTFSLHFLRNKEKQEVDFMLARDNEPLLLIEAKLADAEPAKSLRKFQELLNVPAIQLTNQGDTYRIVPNGKNKILIAPACQWLAHLP